MRIIILYCWMIFGFSLCAQDTAKEGAMGRDPYEGVNFEFDIDLDICGVRSIKKWFNACADFGWRFLGYDSNSFSSVKSYLYYPDNRVELVLAVLSVDKYPGVVGRMAVNYLIEEIVEGKISVFDDPLNNEIKSIQSSKKFSEIYDTISSLNECERRALIKSLVEMEPLLVPKVRNQGLNNYLFQLNQCFKPMLQKIIE